MGSRVARAAPAALAGIIVAFGIAELVHGLYSGVPSIFVSLAQWIVALTPGKFATNAISTFGQADVPILIASMMIVILIVTVLIGLLRLRSAVAAAIAVVILAVIAIAATFSQPNVQIAPTVVTIVAALAVGAALAEFLMRLTGLVRAEKPSSSGRAPDQTAGVRSREAGSSGGIRYPRRGFLALSGGAAVAGLVLIGAGRILGDNSDRQSANKPLSLKNQKGRSGGNAGGNSGNVTHKTLPPPPASASIEVKGMPRLFTPASNFYLIDTALTSPRVDVNNWSLKVSGAVDNPIELSYKELVGMSTKEADITLSCVSNPVGGGLVSNGRWTGVMLPDVLREAGLSQDKIGPASQQLVGRSVDGFTTGFKTPIAFDGRNAMVVFGLNGNELPTDHGYPVRLVVPGLYGYVSATKWLNEIELTNWNFDAYWIQRTWTKYGPVKTQSRLDTVSNGDNLAAGRVPIGGVAWAPHRGISKVEVSTDGGTSWNNARLATPLSKDAWRQYVYDWDAPSGNHTIQVRATDGNGETQTSKERPPHGGGGTDGATGYDTAQVTVT